MMVIVMMVKVGGMMVGSSDDGEGRWYDGR